MKIAGRGFGGNVRKVVIGGEGLGAVERGERLKGGFMSR